MSEINNIKPPLQGNVNAPRQGAVRGGSGNQHNAAAAQQGVDSDRLSLTDTASQLQALQQKIAALPQVDASRVQAIKSAIENGSYQVDSQELARKMIDLEGGF